MIAAIRCSSIQSSQAYGLLAPCEPAPPRSRSPRCPSPRPARPTRAAPAGSGRGGRRSAGARRPARRRGCRDSCSRRRARAPAAGHRRARPRGPGRRRAHGRSPRRRRPRADQREPRRDREPRPSQRRRPGRRSAAAIAASSRAQSSTVRAIGPAQSKLGASGTTPRSEVVAIGRLDRRGAAQRGGDAQRAGGVGPGRGRRHPRRERGARATARATGRAVEGPRVADLIGGPADRELVRVQVSQQDHPRRAQPGPDVAVALRDVLEHAARGGQRLAGHA